MRIRREAWPFVAAAAGVGGLVSALAALGGGAAWAGVCAAATLAGAAGLLAFFRDPERRPPADPAAVLAGADGVIADVREADEPTLGARAVLISTFLGLHNVHVNRAPIAGTVRLLAFKPGRCRLAFRRAASAENQRNTILIEGSGTRCLVHQLTGALVRRVVHWLTPGQTLRAGERIGMMKFGSRLDIYLPKSDIIPTARIGERVRSGETVIARLRAGSNQ